MACEAAYAKRTSINADRAVFRPGDKVKLEVVSIMGPSGPKNWPDSCLSNWRVTPAKYAKYDISKRILTIAKSAPAGTKVEISAELAGGPFSRTLTITGRDEVVLTGIRRQSEDSDCPGGAKVGELQFIEGGQFGVTYQPFESYMDYWGTYQFDPQTGALTMTVQRGNSTGGNLDLEGKAWFRPDGKLQLDGFNFGGARIPGHDYSRPVPAPVPCTYIF